MLQRGSPDDPKAPTAFTVDESGRHKPGCLVLKDADSGTQDGFSRSLHWAIGALRLLRKPRLKWEQIPWKTEPGILFLLSVLCALVVQWQNVRLLTV